MKRFAPGARKLIISLAVVGGFLVIIVPLLLRLLGGMSKPSPPRSYDSSDQYASSQDGGLRSQPLPGPPNLDTVLRQLNWGHIVFDAPSTMQHKKPQIVELLLSPSLSVEQLQMSLGHKAGAESARVHISNRMETELTGSGFAIEALTPNLQAIVRTQVCRWRWQVTPTEGGTQNLYLALSAHIDAAGHDAPLVVRTFDRRIQVEITLPQRVRWFVQNNWQWLWAAVLVPAAGYLWKRRKRDEAKQGTRPSGNGRDSEQ